jgi:hypothetical protein
MPKFRVGDVIRPKDSGDIKFTVEKVTQFKYFLSNGNTSSIWTWGENVDNLWELVPAVKQEFKKWAVAACDLEEGTNTIHIVWAENAKKAQLEAIRICGWSDFDTLEAAFNENDIIGVISEALEIQ